MSGVIFALPVSVEQIAAVIKQMNPTEQQRLLSMVPNLRQIATQSLPRTPDQAQAAVAHWREEVMAALDHQPLSPDDPFLGGLTLAQYHALPDEEKARLWDEWANVDMMELEEQEVSPDALSVG